MKRIDHEWNMGNGRLREQGHRAPGKRHSAPFSARWGRQAQNREQEWPVRACKFSIRILSLALLLCLLALSLAACHGSRGRVDFAVPQAFDTSRQFEITFWAKNDTNKTQTAIYKKAIDDFHALYPNVTVNMKLYTDYGRIYNDVITNIATDTTPNVCITYPDHIATYLTGSNVVVPLDALMADEAYGLGEIHRSGEDRQRYR